MLRRFLMAMMAGVLTSAAALAEPGVTASTLRVGTIQDLSGPIAMLGAPIRDGMLLRFEEANARGGVHGRKLELRFEDSGYDPKRAVLATRKLLSRDKVFAFVGNLGTPVVMASMPLAIEAGRPHLFPFSPHQATYAPLHPLKFQLFAPYQDYMNAAVREMVARGGYTRVGLLFQDDDYGHEVKKGVEAGLAQRGMALVEAVGYKRGATDFASQVARLRAAGCDLVVLATVVRETVAAVSEARKTGWPVDMLVTASGYSAQTHELGGATVEGLYGVSVMPLPYAEGANSALADWIDRYRQRFGAAPNIWSAMGYNVADVFIQGLEAAGRELTAERFVSAMESVHTTRDFFGSPEYRFSATEHLGNRVGRLARITQGRWVLISDYLQ